MYSDVKIEAALSAEGAAPSLSVYVAFPVQCADDGLPVKGRKGKLCVMGSIRFFEDEFYDKEDNMKIQDALFSWLFSEECELEQSVKEENELQEYNYVPDITGLADHLRSCLQDSEELPKDFTTLFSQSLYKFDTDLIPEAIKLYDILGVKHEQISLIPPQFETPMPSL